MPETVKLNLGCGHHVMPGYVNIDRYPGFGADLCFDLEEPWPLPDNHAHEMILHHVLEHLGETTDSFFQVIQEMYRVSAPDCRWLITVPHYNSDNFHIDPTHVRKIHPTTMMMFDQQFNYQDQLNGGHHTKLGLMLAVDIEMVKADYNLTRHWTQLKAQQPNDTDFALHHFNNVCDEIVIECRVHKPARITQHA